MRPSRPGMLGRDLAMVALAVFSIAIVVYDEMTEPVGRLRTALVVVDFVIVVVFVVEFVGRFRAAPDKVAFLKRTWYEVPGMVPMVVGELGFLRFFRLFRVVAVGTRLFRAKRLAQSFLGRTNLGTILGVTSLLLFGAAYAEYFFERNANEDQFANFGEALWWAVVTTTTVGYGDKFPITLGGRIVAGVLMLTGIGLIGTLAATFSNALIRPKSPPLATPEKGARLEERLTALAALREKGALSEAEFQTAKAKILGEQS